MKGKIALRGMLFHSFHGVHQFERERGNDFRIDLVFEADLSRAAMSDNLSDTLDYEEVYRVVSDVMQTPSTCWNTWLTRFQKLCCNVLRSLIQWRWWPPSYRHPLTGSAKSRQSALSGTGSSALTKVKPRASAPS